jgi:hypothetical protein
LQKLKEVSKTLTLHSLYTSLTMIFTIAGAGWGISAYQSARDEKLMAKMSAITINAIKPLSTNIDSLNSHIDSLNSHFERESKSTRKRDVLMFTIFNQYRIQNSRTNEEVIRNQNEIINQMPFFNYLPLENIEKKKFCRSNNQSRNRNLSLK